MQNASGRSTQRSVKECGDIFPPNFINRAGAPVEWITCPILRGQATLATYTGTSFSASSRTVKERYCRLPTGFTFTHVRQRIHHLCWMLGRPLVR